MKNNIKKNNYKSALAIISIAIVLLLAGGISYSFFQAPFTNKNMDANIRTGNLSLIFSDGNPGINEALNFGESVVKTFTVENNGTIDAEAVIKWKNLTNTYQSGSLGFTLESSTEENGEYYLISNASLLDWYCNELNQFFGENKVKGLKEYLRENITIEELAEIFDISESDIQQFQDYIEDDFGYLRNYIQDLVPNQSGNLSDRLKIKAGETVYYKLTIFLNDFSDFDQTADIDATFSTSFELKEYEEFNIKEALIDIKNNQIPRMIENGTPDFTGKISSPSGVYAAEDDYGTSYYFYGDVDNNYIKFGKWASDIPDLYFPLNQNSEGSVTYYSTLEECQNTGRECELLSRADKDMYWRIVRINGDGSVRVTYEGIMPYKNGSEAFDKVAIYNIDFNANDDAKYMGYMYAPEGDTSSTSKEEAQNNIKSSTIKEATDDWYVKNIKNQGYDKYVVDNIFCNDRSTAETPDTWSYSDTTLGYGKNQTYYGAYNRLENNKTPTLKCPQKNDAFTVNDREKGNAALTYPIGLITADELLLIGTKYGYNNDGYKNTYLYKGFDFWTISPSYNDNSHFSTIYAQMANRLDYKQTISNSNIAPTLNLSADYVLSLPSEDVGKIPTFSPTYSISWSYPG